MYRFVLIRNISFAALKKTICKIVHEKDGFV